MSRTATRSVTVIPPTINPLTHLSKVTMQKRRVAGCINRGRHSTDFAVVERYIREHSDETEANDSGIEQ